MSRIGDYEPESVEDELRAWAFSANMKRALAGKKGQAFLREVEAALLALPRKRLAHGWLVERKDVDGPCGDVCVLGAVLLKREISNGLAPDNALRKIAMQAPDPEQEEWDITEQTAELLGICHPLAYGIIQENDEGFGEWERKVTPEQRYERVLKWVREQIKGVVR